MHFPVSEPERIHPLMQTQPRLHGLSIHLRLIMLIIQIFGHGGTQFTISSFIKHPVKNNIWYKRLKYKLSLGRTHRQEIHEHAHGKLLQTSSQR